MRERLEVTETLPETHNAGSYLKIALAFPYVVLQQKVILQRKAAVLIIQLRKEVVEADGGEGIVIGSVLPRRSEFTAHSRHYLQHTKEMLLPFQTVSKDNAFLRLIFFFLLAFISNLHGVITISLAYHCIV